MRRAENWRSGWPVNAANFLHHTSWEFSLHKLHYVAWGTVLLKPLTVQTYFPHIWADIMNQHPPISILIDCLAFSVSEEKWPIVWVCSDSWLKLYWTDVSKTLKNTQCYQKYYNVIDKIIDYFNDMIFDLYNIFVNDFNNNINRLIYPHISW